MVERYKRAGYIRSKSIEEAMLRVPREEFMEPRYREHAYVDSPFPIPGDGRQTISAPYMYPVTYESLGLKRGERFLEVGAGSGYGAALAAELVGEEGLVVTLEINPETYRFALENLRRAGYSWVKVVLGDGSQGYPELAPYDAVSVTASTPRIPPPLLEQLSVGGRLVAPVGGPGHWGQDLVLVTKTNEGYTRRRLMGVVYVPLQGKYGFPE